MAAGPGGVDVATLQINVVMQGAPQAIQQSGTLATQVARVETAGTKSTVSMGRLNNAILGLARQATGAHPVIARFTDVLLGMAYGGPQMTAILAGLGAVAVAYALITREARAAKRATEEHMAALVAAAAKRVPLLGAAERVGVADNEVARIQGQLTAYRTNMRIQPGAGGAVEAQLIAQLSVARGAQIEANRQLVELERQRSQAFTDRLSDGYEFTGPPPREPGTPGASVSRSRMGLTPYGLFGGPSRYTGVNVDLANRVAAEGAARSRPTDMVGPGFPSWALSGSFGQTGAGFASAAKVGAAGVEIIGAVGSIVDGLWNHSERAQAAARQWKMAFEDFALMFDEPDALASNLRANDRQFRELSGGFDAAQIDRLLAMNLPEQFVRQATGQSSDSLRRLAAAYRENADQATKLAAAERDLYDARFRALNAPSGFNLSYYGWQAGFGGTSMGKTKDDGVQVNVYVDGEKVDARMEVKAKRGGPGPYTTTAR